MFLFTDYINPYAFLIAFILGLFINLYFIQPKRYIIKHPNTSEELEELNKSKESK